MRVETLPQQFSGSPAMMGAPLPPIHLHARAGDADDARERSANVSRLLRVTAEHWQVQRSGDAARGA
jgi:hypothetical protein